VSRFYYYLEAALKATDLSQPDLRKIEGQRGVCSHLGDRHKQDQTNQTKGRDSR